MARTPIHPGEILADELEETALSAKKLADVIDVPPNRLYQILAGKRALTADAALRLDVARRQNGSAIQRIPKRTQREKPRSAA